MFIKRKVEHSKINYKNSSNMTQCTAGGICALRHTTSCETCKHNQGNTQRKSYYEPRG